MLARLRPLLLSSASGGGSGGRLLLLSTARGLASSAAEAEETLYEQGEAQHVGSIVAAQLEHKGRGLIGRHSVAVGELLMAVPPAVIIHGDQDEQPEADQLVPALLEAGQRTGLAAALGALFNGTESSRQQLPDLQLMMQGSSSSSGGCGHDHHHHGHQCSHGGGHQQPQQQQPAAQLDADRAATLVRYNAFGDAYEDLAAAAVRGATPRSHVGVWPQFALANHSCLPSTVHYVVGSTMVVRAVEDVPAGGELSVSYLGREEFAPAGARQAVLQERYGFACTCSRCSLEACAPQPLQQALEQVFVSVMQELRPAFLDALQQQDAARLADVQAALLQHEQQLARLLAAHNELLSRGAVRVLQASVYDLYELLLFCEQLLGGASAGGGEGGQALLARLGGCVAILGCVSRGAELHVYLASRLLQHATELRGAESPQATAAAGLLQEAVLLRYGSALSPGLAARLRDANSAVAAELLM